MVVVEVSNKGVVSSWIFPAPLKQTEHGLHFRSEQGVRAGTSGKKKNDTCFFGLGKLLNKEIISTQVFYFEPTPSWDGRFWMPTLFWIMRHEKGIVFMPTFYLFIFTNCVLNLIMVIMAAFQSIFFPNTLREFKRSVLPQNHHLFLACGLAVWWDLWVHHVASIITVVKKMMNYLPIFNVSYHYERPL